MERARHFIELASVPQAAKIDVLRELTAAIEAEYEDAKHDKSAAARLTGERDAQAGKRLEILLDDNCIATIKKLTPEGGEEISFGGIMGGVRLKWNGQISTESTESALSQAQQALREIIEIAKFGMTARTSLINSKFAEIKTLAEAALPSDTQGAQAQEVK
jgi:hypothetical protein